MAKPIWKLKIEAQLRIESRFWAKVNKQGPIHPVLKSRCWLWTATKFSSGYGVFSFGAGQRANRYSWILHYGDIPEELFVLHKCDNPACVNPKHLFLGTHQDNMDDMTQKKRQAVGDRNGSRTKPECLPRGEQHWSKIHPDKIVRGDRHGLRKHPEKAARGDRNGARLYPERMTRGDAHYTRANPEKVLKGETHYKTTLTETDVIEIRRIYAKYKSDPSTGLSQSKLGEKYGISSAAISLIVRRVNWKHV